MLYQYYTEVPKPLEESKLFELFQKYQAGDKEQYNELVVHNLGLIRKIINRQFFDYKGEKEELFSIGEIGLMKAIQTFDLSKKIKFSSYAGRCIMNEILMFLRKNQKYQNGISFDDMISENEKGEQFCYKDFLIDEKSNIENDYLKKETFSHIQELIEAITNERDKKIVKMNFGFLDGKIYNQKEIAKIFSISQSGVSKIVKKYLENIAWVLYGSREIDDISLQILGKKEPTTFYEFLGCTKEEFLMISPILSDYEKELLFMRHGPSLENFNQNLKMSEDVKKDYFVVVNKCRRLLKVQKNSLIRQKIFMVTGGNNLNSHQTQNLLEVEGITIKKVPIRR